MDICAVPYKADGRRVSELGSIKLRERELRFRGIVIPKQPLKNTRTTRGTIQESDQLLVISDQKNQDKSRIWMILNVSRGRKGKSG